MDAAFLAAALTGDFLAASFFTPPAFLAGLFAGAFLETFAAALVAIASSKIIKLFKISVCLGVCVCLCFSLYLASLLAAVVVLIVVAVVALVEAVVVVLVVVVC